MSESNIPDPGDDATPPNQYIPISSLDERNSSARRPTNGWLIAGVVILVAVCLIGGVLGAAAVALYFYNGLSALNVTATQPGSPTEISLAASATFTPRASVTQEVSPTLTTIPTNTLPPSPSLTSTAPVTATVNTKTTPVAKPTWTPCPGIYFSRLYVGDTAFVSFDPPLPNRVRSQPSMTGVYLGMLQPGERVEIIGGPVCANQSIWWEVRSKASGLTGWTAEGDSKAYWLVPAP
jgi:hypothetical protein